MDGWIKLHRKISSSAVFTDPDLFRLWVLCLTKATHKGTTIVLDRQQVTLSPGEFVTGRKSLTDEYNEGLKPRHRKKELAIWRDLKFLEECGNVNIKSTNKYSVISIKKWHEYQETEQQLNNNRTTDEQQLNTNKNVKNEKNVKKVLKDMSYSPEFERFWEAYPKQVGKPAAFNNFKKLLKKHDVEYIIACAMNYASYCLANQTEKQYIKMPNNFLNAKDEYYKQFETPVLIHSKPFRQDVPRKETGFDQMRRLAEEEKARGAVGNH